MASISVRCLFFLLLRERKKVSCVNFASKKNSIFRFFLPLYHRLRLDTSIFFFRITRSYYPKHFFIVIKISHSISYKNVMRSLQQQKKIASSYYWRKIREAINRWFSQNLTKYTIKWLKTNYKCVFSSTSIVFQIIVSLFSTNSTIII